MTVARSISEIDWTSWTPQEFATLCFVRRTHQGREELLLMRKKRGLGAGKIVGPGGRVEAGETPLECAIREVQEEVQVTPTGVECGGEHRFQFRDGYALHVYAFRASGYEGTPAESDEGLPLWTSVDRMPWAEMWADNDRWLPLLLRGEPFSGRWVFEGDQVLDHELDLAFELPPWADAG